MPGDTIFTAYRVVDGKVTDPHEFWGKITDQRVFLAGVGSTTGIIDASIECDVAQVPPFGLGLIAIDVPGRGRLAFDYTGVESDGDRRRAEIQVRGARPQVPVP